VELTAQDHEQPYANIRAGPQKMVAHTGALQRLVNQVIGLICIPAQQDCKARSLGIAVNMASREFKI